LSLRRLPPLRRNAATVLQVNIGKLCNLACKHCHVEAGPARKAENMDGKGVDRILELLSQSSVAAGKGGKIELLDITGGAPELNVHFRRLVLGAKELGVKVMDRCNLSVLFQKGQEDTAKFLADNKVHIIASLPHVRQNGVDKQRGAGSYDYSIRGLKLLNELGYGAANSGLELDLIYNPDGAVLPGPQADLEADFKRILLEEHGISFTRLLTIANMPIKRFADDLAKTLQYTPYMGLLAARFNPSTLPHLMCRNTINVSWDGLLFDCDFSAQLDKRMLKSSADGLAGSEEENPLSIYSVKSLEALEGRKIHTHKACYGCTAGSGSSCSGALLL
jgi:radical SAM/Cys-rich protein